MTRSKLSKRLEHRKERNKNLREFRMREIGSYICRSCNSASTSAKFRIGPTSNFFIGALKQSNRFHYFKEERYNLYLALCANEILSLIGDIFIGSVS